MRALDRAVLRRGVGGRPLPAVFQAFEHRRIQFRRSEVTMIAGQPSAGKSLLALWLATSWVQGHGLRGLYFSADSSELVQASRAFAMVTATHTVDDAEALLTARDEAAVSTLHEALEGLRWSWEPDISYKLLDEEVKAFETMWGSNPDFIIIDNLTDVDGHAEDEWAAMRRIMKALVSLARETGAAVIVLHHTSEAEKDDPCPPRKAIQGKVAQKPAVVLTIGKGGGGLKPIACVKNRWGEDDKSGRTFFNLQFDNQRMHYQG